MPCKSQLGELADVYPEFLKRNVSLAAISTDEMADALQMMELTGAEFAILSDKDAEVSKGYGVYNLLRDGVATPSAVIVSPKGDIEWQYVGRKHLRPAGSPMKFWLRLTELMQ